MTIDLMAWVLDTVAGVPGLNGAYRAFPKKARDAIPYAVVRQVGRSVVHLQDGVETMADLTYSVDVVAATESAAQALLGQVAGALARFNMLETAYYSDFAQENNVFRANATFAVTVGADGRTYTGR